MVHVILMLRMCKLLLLIEDYFGWLEFSPALDPYNWWRELQLPPDTFAPRITGMIRKKIQKIKWCLKKERKKIKQIIIVSSRRWLNSGNIKKRTRFEWGKKMHSEPSNRKLFVQFWIVMKMISFISCIMLLLLMIMTSSRVKWES